MCCICETGCLERARSVPSHSSSPAGTGKAVAGRLPMPFQWVNKRLTKQLHVHAERSWLRQTLVWRLCVAACVVDCGVEEPTFSRDAHHLSAPCRARWCAQTRCCQPLEAPPSGCPSCAQCLQRRKHASSEPMTPRSGTNSLKSSMSKCMTAVLRSRVDGVLLPSAC